MNDVLAMAVFREHERNGAQLNRDGWKGQAHGAARERLAVVLLAVAAWLAPAARIEVGERRVEPAAA